MSLSDSGEAGDHDQFTVLSLAGREGGQQLERYLESIEGIEIVSATTATDAIDIVAQTDIDCLVTTDQLPETDVLTFLESVRRTYPSLPTMLYAYDGDELLASKALATGVTAYVPASAGEDYFFEQLQAALTTPDRSTAATWHVLEALHDVAFELETCSDFEDAYRIAVEAAEKIFDLETCIIYIEKNGILSPRAASEGLQPDALGAFAIGDGIVGNSYEKATSYRIDDVLESEKARPTNEAVRSGIAVPLGEFGVIVSISSEVEAFTDIDVQLLELLSNHVAATYNRIETDAAIRYERDRFASLFENIPDAAVFTRGTDPIEIIDVNPAFEETFGYECPDIVGRPLDELIIPAEAKPLDIHDSVGLEGVLTTEVTRRTASGLREFLVRGFAIEVGGEIHKYGIYTDITEQKEHERELERYRMLVETVGDPMYVLDASGQIEMANEALIQTLGRPSEEVIGAHVREFISTMDVQGGEQLLMDIVQDETRQWDTYEMHIEAADGTLRLFENHVAPLVDTNGTLTGSVGVIRDISERKEREQRMRALYDGTRRLMVSEDVTDVAISGCEIITDVLEFPINRIHLYDEDQHALIPVACSDRTSELLGEPKRIEAGDDPAWVAYEAGHSFAHGDIRFQDGVRDRDAPIKSEAHLPLGTYGLLIISSTRRNDFDGESLTLAKMLAANIEAALERAERESELDRRRRALEHQNDRLEQFAGTVSHDLRNPLTLAAGHLELLEANVHADADGTIDSDDSTRAHIEEIAWALDRMDELIDDVLVLARSGRRLTATEPVSLEAVVTNAARTVDPEPTVTLETSLPTVEADESRLYVLFENLFRNAFEHAGPDVTVTVGATETRFYVADDGPGIAPDERELVLESGYTGSADGTGFGLAIVSEVADAHGWCVEVDESEAGGARFDFVFEETSLEE